MVSKEWKNMTPPKEVQKNTITDAKEIEIHELHVRNSK
jgi:hypothetical protein